MAAVLGGFGFRVQKSVFELRLTRGQREHLLRLLDELQLKTGSVILYRRDSSGKRFERGTPQKRQFDEDSHAWILAG